MPKCGSCYQQKTSDSNARFHSSSRKRSCSRDSCSKNGLCSYVRKIEIAHQQRRDQIGRSFVLGHDRSIIEITNEGSEGSCSGLCNNDRWKCFMRQGVLKVVCGFIITKIWRLIFCPKKDAGFWIMCPVSVSVFLAACAADSFLKMTWRSMLQLDVASILGDAIKYPKELLQKMNALNHELKETPSSSSLTPSSNYHYGCWRPQVLPPYPTSRKSPLKN